MLRLFFTIYLLTCLTSCKSSLVESKYKGTYRIGSAYKIKGESYYPQYYDRYEEVGIASWYEEDCHRCFIVDKCDGCITANGEIFNKNALAAAHRTLPMPSVVKVTNLENNKSVKLKVNDRGPFQDNRIIDVTEKAAKKLGFKEKGLAIVKVEYLRRSTEKLINSHPNYKEPYKKIMKTIGKRKSIFSPYVKKISEQKDFYTPPKKKVTKLLVKIPRIAKEEGRYIRYDVNTNYKKSSRKT